MSESLYLSKLESTAVLGGADNKPIGNTNLNWNQMSDRGVPHIQTGIVPSRGNST